MSRASELVGYWIGRRDWGRGIATRALALFLERVTTRPLYAFVAVNNVGLDTCPGEVRLPRHHDRRTAFHARRGGVRRRGRGAPAGRDDRRPRALDPVRHEKSSRPADCLLKVRIVAVEGPRARRFRRCLRACRPLEQLVPVASVRRLSRTSASGVVLLLSLALVSTGSSSAALATGPPAKAASTAGEPLTPKALVRHIALVDSDFTDGTTV